MIKPSEAKVKFRFFYWGKVYQDSWLHQAIEDAQENPNEIGGNKMLQYKDDHFITENVRENCRKLNISKKKNFTIIEGITLFGLFGTNNTENLNKISFWKNIETN